MGLGAGHRQPRQLGKLKRPTGAAWLDVMADLGHCGPVRLVDRQIEGERKRKIKKVFCSLFCVANDESPGFPA